MNANGFIVQDYNQLWYVPDKYNYMGISAFVTFPLDLINKASARELAKRQQTRTLGEQLEMLEFISDKSLLKEYCKACIEYRISIRLLFLESLYDNEIWSTCNPEGRCIGYECCPIPIDYQIMSDLDWVNELSEYVNKVNSFGLFNTYEDAVNFKSKYSDLINTKGIGDGLLPEDIYIFRIKEIDSTYLNTI